MKTNTEYTEIKQNQNANVISAKLCFENLNCTDYKNGYLITESNLAQEKKNSPLCELAAFTNIIVDKCNVNESNANSIYVNAIANGKDNMQKLYEWIEKYAGKDKVDTIAPGLLEALNLKEDAEKVDEENSVATRFAKYRKLYEDETISEETSVNEDQNHDERKVNEEDDSVSEGDKEENKDDEGKDEENKDDENKDDENKDDENKEDDEEEQDELTAVILEVKKGDEDKLKEELIEAGVDEDDIEILDEKEDEESEDDENKEDESEESDNKDENVKVKIAVDSFDALKEYLEGKGFNLEEELGGEIVSDEDSEDSEDKEDKEDKEELDAEFDGFDDLFK